MTLVVDASVACKWFVVEEGSAAALALAATGESLIAPDLVIAEACNVAWKKRRTGEMTPEQADLLTGQLAGLFQLIFPSAPFAARALAMAESLAHPVYDCFYLALAEHLKVQLVTADEVPGQAPGNGVAGAGGTPRPDALIVAPWQRLRGAHIAAAAASFAKYRRPSARWFS